MSSSAAKKLFDGSDQLLGGLQVFVVVKELHALCLDLSGRHDAVLEHAVHVLCALALTAAGIAALIVEVVVPRGRNALEGEFLLTNSDFLSLSHIFSVAPFR